MKVFICLLAVAALAQAQIDYSKYKPRNIYVEKDGSVHSGAGRIVGGEEASPHQFPWQVALLIDTWAGTFFCGGALVSNNYVLTAAHCVDGAIEVQIIMGAHKFQSQEQGQVRMVSKNAFTHEDWDMSELKNDLGIVKLPQSVEFSDTIQPIVLPGRDDASKDFVGNDAIVSGWGKDSDNAASVSPVLRFVHADIISNERCGEDYNPGDVKPTNICGNGAGGKSSCNGDSGGPLTVEDGGSVKQVGIVSFGRADGCEKGFSHVYTRVTSYLDWIEKNTDVSIS